MVTKSYNILLVDDDRDDREFFCDAIELVCDDVRHVVIEHPTRMMPHLQTTAERPNLILMDVNMPEMSGWECLSLLKSNEDFHDIPVIMYSTSKHTEEFRQARESGAVCFLSKPRNFNVLKEAIKSIIEHLRANKMDQLTHNSKLFF